MADISVPTTIGTASAIDFDKYTVVSLPRADSITAKYIEADKLSEEAIDQIKQLFNAKPLVEYACHN